MNSKIFYIEISEKYKEAYNDCTIYELVNESTELRDLCLWVWKNEINEKLESRVIITHLVNKFKDVLPKNMTHDYYNKGVEIAYTILECMVRKLGGSVDEYMHILFAICINVSIEIGELS